MSTIPQSSAGLMHDSTQAHRSVKTLGQKNGQGLPLNQATQLGTAGTSPFASVMADQQASQGIPLATASTPPKVQQSVQHMSVNDQLMQKATIDKQHMQTLEQLGKNIGKSESLVDIVRNDVTTRNLRTVIGSFNLQGPVMPMANSIKAQALAMQHRRGPLTMPDRPSSLPLEGKKISLKLDTTPLTLGQSSGIGKLSQQFESGSQGISAIGYDRVGGTSYGKYQIASRVGSMDNFLNFLDKNAPDISEKLRAAGPSNTGSRKGEMPDVWRQIAAEEPDRFEALQEKFIYDSHYKPAVTALRQRSSLDGDTFSPAMQEVLFSTAVQHGPTGAARIFSQAATQSGDMTDAQFNERLIDNIYSIRSGQFGASTAAVQESARNRMHREKDLALAMLQKDGTAQA